MTMMKKIAAPLLLLMLFLLLFLQGCLEDPDPIPQTINTYQTYYNYLLEPYKVQWEIDDLLIGYGHSYGVPVEGMAQLDQPEQEVLFRILESDTDRLIDTLSYSLVENGTYMVAILGTEEEPYLLCEPIDTRSPSAGKIKLRFMSKQ